MEIIEDANPGAFRPLDLGFDVNRQDKKRQRASMKTEQALPKAPPQQRVSSIPPYLTTSIIPNFPTDAVGQRTSERLAYQEKTAGGGRIRGCSGKECA